MKKNIKLIVIGVIVVCVLAIIGVAIVINNNGVTNKQYKRPNSDFVAVIYHSEMMGIDAGTEYMYYIYESEENNNEYIYIKATSNITITGSGKEKDIGSGILKNKSDLKKIEKDIKKDTKKDQQSNITYSYINNGSYEKYESIDSLGDKLFK